jgi:hypothetical protein
MLTPEPGNRNPQGPALRLRLRRAARAKGIQWLSDINMVLAEGKGDALAGLQHLTILVAAPFVLVMTGMCWALLRDLRQDPLIVRSELAEQAVEEAVIAGHEKYAGGFEIRIGPAQDEAPGGTKDDRDRKDPAAPPPAS